MHASDIDTGSGGRIRYTQILGYLNTSLNLNPDNGVIIVSTDNHGFDREMMPEYHLYVEARDNDGTGNSAQVPIILKIIDVNDNAPVFEKPIYEFILSSNLRNFTIPAYVKAIDADAEEPNNVVRYEIISGNYENKFRLDKYTGKRLNSEWACHIKYNHTVRCSKCVCVYYDYFALANEASICMIWRFNPISVFICFFLGVACVGCSRSSI